MAKNIRMLKQFASPELVLDEGKTYRVGDTTYENLSKAGACVLIGKDEKRPNERFEVPTETPDPEDKLKGKSRNAITNPEIINNDDDADEDEGETTKGSKRSKAKPKPDEIVNI